MVKTNLLRLTLAISTLVVLCVAPAGLETSLYAADKFVDGSAGGSGVRELPLFVARDLGIFKKYGLDVETVVIRGGSPLVQALVGGSVQSASVAAMAPIRAIHSGAKLQIVAGFLNKNMYSFVTSPKIEKPSDLKGKSIGVASFGAANEFSVLMVLKRFGISPDDVKIRVAGGSLARLAAIQKGALDATVIPHSNDAVALSKGIRIMADLEKLVKEFPDGTIVLRKDLTNRERGSAKRFLQAISEAIYRLKTEPQLRESVVATIQKHMRVKHQRAEKVYGEYQNVFSYPPRVGREGLTDVLEIMARQSGKPQSEFKIDRYLDESMLDELAAEGFFKTLEASSR